MRTRGWGEVDINRQALCKRWWGRNTGRTVKEDQRETRTVRIRYPGKGQNMFALSLLSPALYGLALPGFRTPASVIGAESYGLKRV